MFLHRNIVSSIKDGFNYEYYFDLFVLNLVVFSFSPFSDKVYYLFSIVPLFLLYKLFGLIRSYVFGGTQSEMSLSAEEEKKMNKRKEKKERREKRERRRVVQR